MEVYGPQLDTTRPSIISLSSFNVLIANSSAASMRRFSFMRTILLRTILRQEEPSSLGWTTVMVPDEGYNQHAISMQSAIFVGLDDGDGT